MDSGFVTAWRFEMTGDGVSPMTEVCSEQERRPLPLAMPILLSFVAGYVDSYTYLTLFGLFVAQVTSSFVVAGAEVVTHDYNIAGKVLVVVMFVVAAALTAALIGLARDKDRAPLPLMLALEALLLALFAAMLLFGPPVRSATDWHGIVAGLFAAGAMGAQSVLVRLLMKGTPQTNVMTGNMTQLGIATTEMILAWRRLARGHHGAAAVREFEDVRGQLLVVLAIALGFLIGAASGAVTFAVIGITGALVSVGIVGTLALWALIRESGA
jgi:uncharacterized membrane protein YoaK (UPF0700 family)